MYLKKYSENEKCCQHCFTEKEQQSPLSTLSVVMMIRAEGVTRGREGPQVGAQSVPRLLVFDNLESSDLKFMFDFIAGKCKKTVSKQQRCP